MSESEYKTKVIKKVERRLPGCIVLKNDAQYKQGIPDLTIFLGNRWGTLEFKKTRNSRKQPNQDYYVDKMNKMSFSSFIYPENEEEVLDALEQALAA